MKNFFLLRIKKRRSLVSVFVVLINVFLFGLDQAFKVKNLLVSLNKKINQGYVSSRYI